MLRSIVHNKIISVMVPIILAGFALVEVVEDLSDFWRSSWHPPTRHSSDIACGSLSSCG